MSGFYVVGFDSIISFCGGKLAYIKLQTKEKVYVFSRKVENFFPQI